jgi:hypothetical protein
MKTDYPTLSEVGEENVREYWKRKQRKQREGDYDEVQMPKVLR